MGKRGPAPKPTALKIVDGTRKSRMNLDEPAYKVPDGAPAPPEWLSEYGKAYWIDLVPQMVAKGVLTTADLHGLAVLCQAFDMHQRAAEMLNGAAIVADGERGKVRHVALQVLRDTAFTIKTWSQEFGLTPSSRSGIKVTEQAKGSEARKLLSG